MGWRGRPLLLLVSIIHVMLQVPLSTVLLILPMEELSMLLRVFLTKMIEPHMKASKLVSEKLTEKDLHLSRWLRLGRH